jgi:uncharacterized protein YwgA
MSMNEAILAVLSDGAAQGRTLFQKKLYFLSVLTGEGFEFRPHYFGPYSSKASTSLSALVEADFIRESRVGYGIPTEFGEMSRYDYELSDSGKKVVDSRADVISRYAKYLAKINDSGVAADINTISIAAKVHFIISNQGENQGKMTISQVRSQARSLGWDLSSMSVTGVVKYLQNLGLVEAR